MAFHRRETLPSGRVVFRAYWRENGKQRSKYFPAEKAARLYAGQMADRIERQGVSDPDRLTCAAFFERYVDALRARGELSPSTLRLYAGNLSRWAALIGGLKLATVSTNEIEDALTALIKGGISASTARLSRTILRTCFEAARRRKLRADNPVTDCLAPANPKGQKRKPKPFTADEVARLLAAAKQSSLGGTLFFHGIEAALTVLLATGLRRGELLGLKWSDLDGGVLTVNRTVIPDEDGSPLLREGIAKTAGSLRPISLPPAAVEALRLHRIAQAELALKLGPEFDRSLGLIFPWWTGAPMWPSTASSHFRKLCKIAGIKDKQPVHAARHHHGSTLLAAGIDLATVSARLGHTTPVVTLAFYAHSDQAKDEAAAAKIGAILEALK